MSKRLLAFFLVLCSFAAFSSCGDKIEVTPSVGICTVPTSEEQLNEAVKSVKKYDDIFFDPKFRNETFVGSYLASDRAVYVRELSFGEGEDRITVFVADVYIDSITEMVGYVLYDEDGKIKKGNASEAVEATGAILAINSDFLGARNWGLYVRNGKLVKKAGETSGIDVCSIGRDGIMRVYDGDTLDADDLLDDPNLYHVFSFGPSLLNADGSPRNKDSEFHITDRYQKWNVYDSSVGFPVPNPRTAIGQAKDGHFILVAADGRKKGYSRGMTFPELSHLMYEEGAVVAYNLDGGGSETMWFMGKEINTRVIGPTPRYPTDYIVILPSSDKDVKVKESN